MSSHAKRLRLMLHNVPNSRWCHRLRPAAWYEPQPSRSWSESACCYVPGQTAGSTIRGEFADRIRWNQAHYRLAQTSRLPL